MVVSIASKEMCNDRLTERCYRLRLQLEDGTGGREGETENDWKFEMGKFEIGLGRRNRECKRTLE